MLFRSQPHGVAVSRFLPSMSILCSLLLMSISSTTDASSFQHIRRGDDTAIDHRILSSKSGKRSFNYSIAHWHDDSKGKSGDEFGEAIAIQNNVAIVASPLQSDFPLYEVSDGKVFVFIDTAGTNDWEVIREISGEDASEFFGTAVALHVHNGNYLAVVGAPRGSRYGQFSGGAYYFNVQTDSTKDQDYPIHLVQKERHGGANFGCSVAISEVNGEVRVAIGATGHRGKGAVFVYTQAKDGSLTNEVILYGSVAKSGGDFGYTVAFNDNLVVVGAPVLQHGTVFIFSATDSGSFVQVKVMSAPAAVSEDVTNDDAVNTVYYYYGGSLAVGNGFLFVGSPMSNLRGQNSGSVYVYSLDDIYNPNFMQTLFPPVNDANGLDFGWSLSFDVVNYKLLVGSCNRQSTTAAGGKAFVYAQKGAGYFLETALYANKFVSDRKKSESTNSLFGKGVSIYGDYSMVGAPFGNGEQYSSGDVYFYKAQSKKEFTSDSSEDGAVGMIDFSSTTVQIVAIAGVLLLFLICLYRRYSKQGDEEGFGNFLSTGCVTDEEGEDTSFNEDSAHSNHPMIVRTTKEGAAKKSKAKKGKAAAGKKSGGKGGKSAYASVQNEDL